MCVCTHVCLCGDVSLFCPSLSFCHLLPFPLPNGGMIVKNLSAGGGKVWVQILGAPFTT